MQSVVHPCGRGSGELAERPHGWGRLQKGLRLLLLDKLLRELLRDGWLRCRHMR